MHQTVVLDLAPTHHSVLYLQRNIRQRTKFRIDRRGKFCMPHMGLYYAMFSCINRVMQSICGILIVKLRMPWIVISKFVSQYVIIRPFNYLCTNLWPTNLASAYHSVLFLLCNAGQLTQFQTGEGNPPCRSNTWWDTCMCGDAWKCSKLMVGWWLMNI